MDFDLSPDQLDLHARATEAGAEFREHARRWDADNVAPYREITQRMGELGFFGLTMPKQYGGQGGTALDYLIATAAIFRAAQTWQPCEPLFCTTGPGPAMILLADSEDLKNKYVPAIVQGELGCAIALTEPRHGSDLNHLETTAVIDGDEIILNGDKSFVTGAVDNELYAVFARFEGTPGHRGIGAVVVEGDAEGVTLERGPSFVGLRGLAHGNVTLRNARVPLVNLIQGPGSFARLMTAFNLERLHNASFTLGMAEAAFDEVTAYVRKREVFGRPVMEFQSTYHTLAEMWTIIEAHRLLCYRAAATAVDGTFPQALPVTIAKLFGGTRLPDLTLKALELHGGNGVDLDYPIQRIHRDAISAIVAGGAPAVLRNSIASQLFPDMRFRQERGA
ncbi:acyl-CoA dehydrogenase family protein [Micromonospora sp. HUAS LYJ1]|uniref:acyl-CoA dehydrogenase family protein n=1 Tax=Micromonospora sp. HUAS LYJ1 TaxID=3061626 RepID=UPI0026733F45|nr:acyl-CoA dehydrogenase family protein [Micromonospora sp. HUAS LYJ1]WKU03547.1 acyl-CoA dehydrogenase family protein [Micromonospora sp. HUAS LYJ1]